MLFIPACARKSIEPKFHYGEKLVVVDGFYEGCWVKVKGIRPIAYTREYEAEIIGEDNNVVIVEEDDMARILYDSSGSEIDSPFMWKRSLVGESK